MPRFFGIDPGNSGGGIAWIDDKHCLFCGPMPVSEFTTWVYFDTQINPKTDYAVIEEVSGYMPGEKRRTKDGVEYQVGVAPGSTMFSFGQNYGSLRMALTATGMIEKESWFTVKPKAWQKWLREYLAALPVDHYAHGVTLPPRASKGGETKSQWKKRLKEVAVYLFPRYRDIITLKTADAILLSLYCKHNCERFSVGRTLWE